MCALQYLVTLPGQWSFARSVLGLLICCLFSGCALIPDKHFPLSSTSMQPQLQVAQQQWQLVDRDLHYSFQVIVERAPDHWQWVMMNNLGQRLVTATIANDKLRLEQSMLPNPAQSLIPELLDAVQFCYWPLADLQAKTAQGWSVRESAAQRDIGFSGILRATVNYQSPNPWQGSLTYTNNKPGFSLTIESELLN